MAVTSGRATLWLCSTPATLVDSFNELSFHVQASHRAVVKQILLPPDLTMNGVNGNVGPPGLWQEARNADGRVYYYNTITKATQWTKPEELMTPAEVMKAKLQSHPKLDC